MNGCGGGGLTVIVDFFFFPGGAVWLIKRSANIFGGDLVTKAVHRF